jgi:riboflavin synthase
MGEAVFTGLIESLGVVVDNHASGNGRRLRVETSFEALVSGESIAVNGVCLTVLPDIESMTEKSGSIISFDVSPETLNLTALSHLESDAPVNLERSLLVGSRMGGHYVSGHVDTTAHIQTMRVDGEFVEMTIGDFGVNPSAFLLPKGSITLDGVSLTINQVTQDCVMVMLVPHTLAMTTFGTSTMGRVVNVEFDYLARMIAHQLSMIMPQSNIL